MAPTIGRRELPRHSTWVPGELRTGRGRPYSVEVVDLSESGCRINERSAWLRAPSEVTIRIGALESLDATIRWVRDGQAGLEFRRPIYGPVFEHLRDLLASSAAMDDRRTLLRDVPASRPVASSVTSGGIERRARRSHPFKSNW